jgi:hypothetical protein
MSLLAACVQDAQGCAYESQTETCTNGACTGNPGIAECCTNVCTTGATQCSDGATLQTCGPASTGCTDFVNSLCSSGLVCERSAAASCADPHWAEWRMPNDAADAAAGAPNGASYKDNQDGTVTDNVTSLMWQQTVPTTTFTWDAAGAHCPTLTLGGHSDWRLPAVIELISIVDYGRTSAPLIDGTAFPSTPSAQFWASDLYGGSLNIADLVNFNTGVVFDAYLTSTYYVRCVR